MLINPIIILIIGSIFGSFATVVYSRFLIGQSIVDPSFSYCDNCEKNLRWYEKIPLVSFIFQKGRCNSCNQNIDHTYLLIELSVVLLVLISNLIAKDAVQLIMLCFLSTITLPVSLIDLKIKRIPNTISATFLIFVIISLILSKILLGVNNSNSLIQLITSGLIVIFFLAVYFFSRGGIGFGDVKLSAPISLLVGYFSWEQAVTGMIFAFYIGGILGVALLVLRKANRKFEIPFAPFMLLGNWLALIFGQSISIYIVDFWVP